VVEDRDTHSGAELRVRLRALQEHKFEKAKGHLQKALTGPDKALVDRAQVHILTCDKNLDKTALQFKSTEEHYDYAVSLINSGDYVTRASISTSCEAESEVRVRSYGLRVGLPDGHIEESMKTLGAAIEVKPRCASRRGTTPTSKIWRKIALYGIVVSDRARRSGTAEEEASAY